MSAIDRRAFLGATAAGLTALLAGCQSGDSRAPDSTETGTREATPTDTATGTPTTTLSSEKSTALKRRATDFVELLDEGAYGDAYERFGPATAEEISPDGLERLWTTFEGQIGAFLDLSKLEASPQDDYAVVTGILEFEDGRREAVLAFGTDSVVGFRIRRLSDT